jgi:hypothetical protein
MAIAATNVDQVLPLSKLAALLGNLCRELEVGHG